MARVLVVLALFAAGCNYCTYTTQYGLCVIEEPGNEPGEVAVDAASHACVDFWARQGYEYPELVNALDGIVVRFMAMPYVEQAGGKWASITHKDPGLVKVSSAGNPLGSLQHELAHVVLFDVQPEVLGSDHHEWMCMVGFQGGRWCHQ